MQTQEQRENENTIRLRERIAQQIEEIAKENIRIDAKILQFLKEDFAQIRREAHEKGVGFATLLKEILLGIEKGLIVGGVESVKEIRRILGASKKELGTLEEAWQREKERAKNE